MYAARPSIYKSGNEREWGDINNASVVAGLLPTSSKYETKGETLVIVTYEARIILSAAIVPIAEFNPDVLTNRLKSIPLKRRKKDVALEWTREIELLTSRKSHGERERERLT